MMDDKATLNPTTVLEHAALWWLDLWELAGEKWPPENVALSLAFVRTPQAQTNRSRRE